MPSVLEGDVSALFVEAVFYGVYLSTLLLCLRLLVYAHDAWKPRHLINWSLLTLTLVIWATSSLDLVLAFRRSITRISHMQYYSIPNLMWSDTLMVWTNHHPVIICPKANKLIGPPCTFSRPSCGCSNGEVFSVNQVDAA
jgi:hypothetical protein